MQRRIKTARMRREPQVAQERRGAMSQEVSANTSEIEPMSQMRRRRRRLRAKLAVGTIVAAVAVPGVAAAAPAPSSHTDGDESGVVLRRDGSQADLFVPGASVATSTTSDGDDFAWGDAAIGAGAALGLVAIAGGGLALHRRGAYAGRSVPTAS
jgi:hypothetical protein